MNVSYDYYRIFYYVATCGNITKAAKLLMNNQPNLTRAIQNLESELGVTLFLRTRRGMKLTPEGERLYEHVKIAFEHIEAGEEEIKRSESLESGTVFIAASEVALRCLLLPVLKKYRQLYPGIHIKISNHSTPQAVAALEEGAADIAVVTTPVPPLSSLEAENLLPVREIPVCSNKFSFLKNKKVSLAELQKYPLISLGGGTMSLEFYADIFSSYGLEPFSPDIEAATADQILPMVEADLGIGFVPEEFIGDNSQIIKIDLMEELPERNICLIKRKNSSLSVAAKELEKMIKKNVEAKKLP